MNITKFLIDNIAIIAAALVSGAMLAWPSLMRRPGAGSVGAVEATRLANREKAVFVDVGEPAEFASGHVTGSKNIPIGDIEKRLKDLPSNKQTPLIVVCASGARANKAAVVLRSKGYERVMPLQQGLAGWKAAGMPVERAQSA
jgi:rhodanese-related sulfurtransferase